jgi:hypothetical protein
MRREPQAEWERGGEKGKRMTATATATTKRSRDALPLAFEMIENNSHARIAARPKARPKATRGER